MSSVIFYLSEIDGMTIKEFLENFIDNKELLIEEQNIDRRTKYK
jgi:hypothetical protein